MKFRIVAVGRRMPAWINAGFDEYTQRMPRDARIELIEIKPAARAGSGDKSAQQWRLIEADRIRAALPPRAFRAVLDERGKALTTAEFARRIERWKQDGDDVAFVIGGADGTAPELHQDAGLLLSLSPLTLPHGLCRVMLAEQLYRAVSLLAGHPYRGSEKAGFRSPDSAFSLKPVWRPWFCRIQNPCSNNMPKPTVQIYLASRSPRRRELLRQIGVEFDELLAHVEHGADVDETPLAGEPPADYVVRLALAKAALGSRHVQARRLAAHPVLAADTTVALAGAIIGKPDDAAHARHLLRRLSGNTHEVLTAVAVALGGRTQTVIAVSTVEFRKLDDAEIGDYVATGEPLDKAGAYAIQGRAATFVRVLRGSYSGIMGLPLVETAGLLRRFGIEPANFIQGAHG